MGDVFLGGQGRSRAAEPRHRPEYILSRGKEDASTTSIPHHFMHNSTTNDWPSR